MTTATSPAVRSGVENLVLARLVMPSQKPPSAGDVRAAVAKVTGSPLTADEFAELTTRLRAEGLVEPRPRSRGGVQLTDAGRAAALEYLGLTALPPRTTWKQVRAKYLFPKAIGADADAAKLDTADRLGAFLIRREHELPAGTTVRRALEALVCKLVGRSNETTLDGLFRAVLSEELRADGPLSKDDLLKQFPRRLAGTKTGKMDDLRAAVVAEWLRTDDRTEDPAPPVAEMTDPEPLDLAAFAATVKRIARDCPPEARFGANKAFIAAVWRDSQAEASFPPMSLADFKAALAEASRDGLIRLEPADLVQAMDPKLVTESETVRAGAAFHFVLVEESHP
jgi:hypothetical protein